MKLHCAESVVTPAILSWCPAQLWWCLLLLAPSWDNGDDHTPQEGDVCLTFLTVPGMYVGHSVTSRKIQDLKDTGYGSYSYDRLNNKDGDASWNLLYSSLLMTVALTTNLMSGDREGYFLESPIDWSGMTLIPIIPNTSQNIRDFTWSLGNCVEPPAEQDDISTQTDIISCISLQWNNTSDFT